MKKFIIILFMLVVDIYASGDGNVIMLSRKAKDLNTTIDCARGFYGKLQCYKTGLNCQPYVHCKVTCTSKNWTYFYLFNTDWIGNQPVKFYVSPMTPKSTVMKSIKCFTGYNTSIKECISSSDYTTYISLVCKLNCTSSYNHYMAQSDNIFNFENGSKSYQNDHYISNYEPWQTIGKMPYRLCFDE